MDSRSIVRGSAVVVSNPFQGWVQLGERKGSMVSG